MTSPLTTPAVPSPTVRWTPGCGADRRGLIGYALVSAAFAGAVVFGALAVPVLLFDLPDLPATALKWLALTLTPVLFVARVVSVMVRFRRTAQPSQPGRTSPDS